MRLTCPNCGAQYEVPDEVIPYEGRDVQCSNCGDTWFFAHPDNPDTAADPDADTGADPGADTGADPGPGETQQYPTPEPTESEPDAQAIQATPDDPEPAQEAPDPDPRQPEIDSGISEILREEAEREAQLRASETTDALESQPDLGLDSAPADEHAQRAREARARMARMRGEQAAPHDAAAGTGSRRELLPNIEEINSTLRDSDNGPSSNTAVGPALAEETRKKKNGFSRGFALVLVLGVILAVVYINAPKIAKTVPQADPMLSSYVTLVDQARLWLDARLGEFVSKPQE